MNPSTDVERIGVLTGGGDCPGLNAAIRAVVKPAIYEHDIEVIGIEDGYNGLVQDKMTPLGWDDVSGILAQGGTILGASNKANPFKYYPPDNETKKATDMSEQCVKNFEDAGLDALVCIGGDGTLTIANKLQDLGIPVVGIPKTIDNDVVETDVTFGFGTAVQIVANAVDRIHTTAQSHQRVMVIETMGRYTGWLALNGGMAGGGDIILIPEIEYSIENVCNAIRERHQMGRRFSIVVVAEGVKTPSGEFVERGHVEDSYDQRRLGGISKYLADEIEERTGDETRATILGHVQRGGTPIARDRLLATLLGHEALNAAADGNFGTMAALRGTKTETVSLDKVAGRQRRVDPSGDLVETARAVATYLGD
ncbi:6-phosphofructokinase [candidate division MSBL1 archaeon SCGC-AAA382N08]|uniref:ATP-dependent 6-phosphofructokinase n=1 Tax=candidate division MSBL1 archaeon SCGC-AAA382N08 TaxID=1698285 RepID=A0A133VQR8_9EURY|nr:6-phosphofructokinase [candidate division MSBL1 archaeon SCGC-AAA382N08]